MPYLNRKGPRGMGPRTGLGFGLCPFGMGYGRGQDFSDKFTPAEKLAILEDEEKVLQSELDRIKKEKIFLDSK